MIRTAVRTAPRIRIRDWREDGGRRYTRGMLEDYPKASILMTVFEVRKFVYLFRTIMASLLSYFRQFILSPILLISCIHCQSYQNYTNFQNLGITLPIALQQHISAVYNNKLYVFGGRNGTALNNPDFSKGFWSLDLSQLNLELSSSKNDIDKSAIDLSVSWTELSVTPPTYGPSTTGFISCPHQCSTVIGQYIYIFSPYGDSTYSASEYVYRLDLSQDPPVYSSVNDFSSISGTARSEPCITSTADGQYIYMVSGSTDELVRYDVADDELSFNLNSFQFICFPKFQPIKK